MHDPEGIPASGAPAPVSPVSSDQTAARSAAQRRRRWVGHAVRWIIGIGAAVVAFNALFGRRDELSGALSTLEHVHYGWVVFAVIAELASIGAYAALTRQLLRAGGIDISLGGLTGITLAANAIQNSLPAGPAWSTLYAYRQFRRRGADPVLVGWTLAISVLISIATLGAIALVGLVRAVQRMVRRPRGDATDLVNRAFERLRVVNLTKRSLATAAAWAMANWWLDLTALALSFVAVGSKVPWRGLLLAYGAGQLAANLPVTLGGLGVVEGSLTVALVFYGGAQEATVAAVLLYRIISFWMMLLVGWTAALVIKIRTPKLEEARAR